MTQRFVISGSVVDANNPLPVEEQGGGPTGDGIITTPTHTFFPVTNATQEVLPANAAALTRLFINDGALVIYLAKGVAAAVNRGIRLNPLGGSHYMSPKTNNLYRGSVNAISTAAGPTNLLIEEGV